VRVARVGLRRAATAFAATGGVLLVLTPFLDVAQGAPAEGLDNSLFARATFEVWAAFLLAAAVVPIGLALWDSESRARLAGPCLLVFSGAGSTLGAFYLRSSELFDPCFWAGLRDRYCAYGQYAPYEASQALSAVSSAARFSWAAGVVLPLTRRYPPVESERRRRRRRLRSFSYM
jgi:hypothetical protein